MDPVDEHNQELKDQQREKEVQKLQSENEALKAELQKAKEEKLKLQEGHDYYKVEFHTAKAEVKALLNEKSSVTLPKDIQKQIDEKKERDERIAYRSRYHEQRNPFVQKKPEQEEKKKDSAEKPRIKVE